MKINGGRRRSRSKAGFTVVELLITLLVVAVVFLAFTTTFAGLENISKKGNDVALASTAALTKLQEYENKSFANLPATTPQNSLQQVEDFAASLPPALQSPRNAKVYINTQSPTLKQVVVRVGYMDTAHFVEFGTFIQRSGIGR